MSTDFGEALPLNQIRDGARVELVADDKERARIAERLGLESLDRLEAHALLERDGDSVRAKGRLKAALVQRCVVTSDPIATHADEAFEILFRAHPGTAPDEEIELGAEDCDVVFHDGASIELGDAIADTLALSLDPYPRSAGAEATLREAGVLSEAQAGPFAALESLKREDPGET